jgi:ATP-dependent Clp protease protease subunit
MSHNIYIKETDIYSKLYEERIIFLHQEINEFNATLIKAQLLYLDKISNDPIKIYIDSPGGEVYTGMGIIDTMKFVKSPIETVNIGLAASMAAVILACGDKRSSLKHSRTMIHQPVGGDWGQSSDVEITGKTRKQVELDADRDYWMGAKEAKKYGLIDHIIK